jgi:hypothetical protein
VLDAEATSAKPRWDKVEALAAEVLRAGDAAKLKVSTARFRAAQAFRWKPTPKRSDVIERFEDARKRAVDDGIPDAAYTELRRRFRDYLLEAERPTQSDCERAMALSAELGETATENPAAQADHLLSAAECALRLRKASEATKYLDAAEKKLTTLEGERKTRADQIRAELDKLAAG